MTVEVVGEGCDAERQRGGRRRTAQGSIGFKATAGTFPCFSLPFLALLRNPFQGPRTPSPWDKPGKKVQGEGHGALPARRWAPRHRSTPVRGDQGRRSSLPSMGQIWAWHPARDSVESGGDLDSLLTALVPNPLCLGKTPRFRPLTEFSGSQTCGFSPGPGMW